MKKIKKKQSKTKIQKIDDSSPTSTFFLSFVGEYVEIICKEISSTTEIGTIPLVINGFLLDIDDNYLYLSDDAQSVSRAIKKADYSVIEIVKQYNVLDEALKRVEIPDNPDEGN